MFKALHSYHKQVVDKKVGKQVDKAIALKQKQDFLRYLLKKGLDRVHTDDILFAGFCLLSQQKNYCLTVTQDGNVIIYVSTHMAKANIIFNSGSAGKGKGPFKLILQGDGNLVLYDSQNSAVWSTNTFGKGTAPFTLLMQDDGNLCLFDSHCQLTWQSNTSRQ